VCFICSLVGIVAWSKGFDVMIEPRHSDPRMLLLSVISTASVGALVYRLGRLPGLRWARSLWMAAGCGLFGATPCFLVFAI